MPKIIPPSLILTLSLSSTLLGQQPAAQGAPLTPRLPELRTTTLGSTLDAETGVRHTSLPALASYQAPAVEDEGEWKSSFTLGATVTSGNTRRRTANAAFDAERREGKHRSTAKAAWNYAQRKETGNTSSGQYEIEQRRTQGLVKQDYFIAEKSFLFAAVEATSDYDQNLELRTVATAGYGVQLLDEKDMSYSLEFGAGYHTETSRVAGVPHTDYVTGKVVSDLGKQLNETWKLLNTITYLPSLEDSDELSGVCDTRLRGKMSEGMFVQLQWVIDYDNTPLADAFGNPNTRVDHLIFLSVGWNF